jgi:hypothetical protein
VIPEYLFLDAPERGPHGRDLRDDIDAIAILVDHPEEASNLALDPAQTLLTGRLDVFSHRPYIPLLGIGCKWLEHDPEKWNRFSEKIMLKQEHGREHDSIQLKHALGGECDDQSRKHRRRRRCKGLRLFGQGGAVGGNDKKGLLRRGPRSRLA